MKFFFITLIFFLLQNCSKPKTVLICGDHICINKTEAEQYFEENLSIEVKIINKKADNNFNLVELNLRENSNKKRQINIAKKDKINKNIKILSNNEVLEIKKNIKKKEKNKKIVKKIFKKKKSKNIEIENDNKVFIGKKSNISKNRSMRERKDLVDVCTIIKKCDIEEISKYLIKQGSKNAFPDITLRE